MSVKAACADVQIGADGLGTRAIVADDRHGTVELLDLAPALATPASERSIRSRAGRFSDFSGGVMATVHRVDRIGERLTVVAACVPGIRLSRILGALSARAISLPDAAVLELAGMVIDAAASVHELPGGLAHGAINPMHVVITHDSRVVLTDSVFGSALEGLQRNRDRVWGEYQLALPPAAGVPRFDQRTDVTQLGATVLALFVGRPLTRDEYPRGMQDLLGHVAQLPRYGPELSSWLQQALQIHAVSAFRTAVEARRAFAAIAAHASRRIAAQEALRAALRAAVDLPPVVLSNRSPS